MRRWHTQTGLRLWQTCPLRYKRRYLEGRPDLETSWMQAGSLVHGVLAEYHEALALSGRVTDLDLLREMAVEVRPSKAGVSAPVVAEARDLIRVFADRHPVYEALHGEQLGYRYECGVEVRLAVEADGRGIPPAGGEELDGDPYLATGGLDLVIRRDDGRAWVYDWKTGWRMETGGEGEADLQRKVYAYLLFAGDSDVQSLDCVWYWLRYGREMTVRFDRHQMEELWSEIRLYCEEIECARECEARIGPHCSHCAYRADCEAYQESLSRVAVGVTLLEAGDAVGAATLYQQATVVLRDLEESLRRWSAENGPIEIGGEELGYHPKVKRTIGDLESAVQALLRHGVEREVVYASLSLAVRKAERLARGCRDREAALLELRAHIVEDAGHEWGWSQLGSSMAEGT